MRRGEAWRPRPPGVPLFPLVVLAELGWALFGSLQLRLGMGMPGGWRALLWLGGAIAIPLIAGLWALLADRGAWPGR